MFFGAHFSVKPSLPEALGRAEALGCTAMQVFGYRRHEFLFDPNLEEAARARLEAEISQWRQALVQSPVKKVAVHSRAVAILAADRSLRQKTVQKFRQELALAQKLGAHYYIFHLGPYSEGLNPDTGLGLACEALMEILERHSPQAPRVLLENVPGGGRRLGSTLQELALIASGLQKHRDRFGFCMDTAHLWTAGYEINSLNRIEYFSREFQDCLGLDSVYAIHFNNSSLSLGCHLDEHRHLWEGHIPKEVYAYLVREWSHAAGILETPKDFPGADSENLQFLRLLT